MVHRRVFREDGTVQEDEVRRTWRLVVGGLGGREMLEGPAQEEEDEEDVGDGVLEELG